MKTASIVTLFLFLVLDRNIIKFIQEASPTLDELILYIPISFIYTLLAVLIVIWLKKKQLKTAYTRKIFHVIIFSGAGVIQLSAGLSEVIIYGSIVSIIVIGGVIKGSGNSFYEALARPRDNPKRSLFIIIPLLTTAVGGVISNILFLQFAAIGYLVNGIGDAVGEPIGAYFGKRWYKVPSIGGVPAKRSVEGSLGVLIFSVLSALIALIIMDVKLEEAVLIALVIGFISTIIEAVSPHGTDNLTLQLAASGTGYLMLNFA